MDLFRLIFIAVSLAAIIAATYVSYQGWGATAQNTQAAAPSVASVRSGSYRSGGGDGFLRIK